MRFVCTDANNTCETVEISNPLNIPDSKYLFWLNVDKWDQLTMSYAMWTMGFTLAMVDHNYHIYPNAGLTFKEYVWYDVQPFAMFYIFMTHDDCTNGITSWFWGKWQGVWCLNRSLFYFM